MSIVVKNFTPRQRFQESTDNVSKHRDLVASREFERASDFAMASYVARLCAQSSVDFNNMAAMGLRILGAHEYLQEMKMLAEAPTNIAKIPTPNLDHKS